MQKAYRLIIMGDDGDAAEVAARLTSVPGLIVQARIRPQEFDSWTDPVDTLLGFHADTLVLATPELAERVDPFRSRLAGLEVLELTGNGLVGRLLHDLRQATVSQLELQAVLDSSSDAIEVVNRDGTVKYINAAFTKMTRHGAEARVGRNVFDFSPNGPFATVLRTGRPVRSYPAKSIRGLANFTPVIQGDEMVGAVMVMRDLEDVLAVEQPAEIHRQLVATMSRRLHENLPPEMTFRNVVGRSPVIQQAIQQARRAAISDSTVLLLGESGTGKEVFAEAIHNSSVRRDGPFIKVNCAAIPEALLESELFGHEKGAFTGAVSAKPGLVELADRGTLLLDEIGDMGAHLQARVLRVLQDREVRRVGGTSVRRIDVRIIASTNRKLADLIKEGSFREDLYYRLCVIEINLPPLRERIEDLPYLAEYILDRLVQRHPRRRPHLTAEAYRLLERYHWPGNVRELENVLERALVMHSGEEVGPEHLMIPGKSPTALPQQVRQLADVECELIRAALSQYGSDTAGKRKAAAALGISTATLYNRLREMESGSEGFVNRKRRLRN